MVYKMKHKKGGFPFKTDDKIKKSTESAHGQLEDAQVEYEEDLKNQSVDPDAPGTPGKPGFEPPVTSIDYLTKIPVGPRATKKPLDREKWEEENRIEHNVEAKMDEYPPKYFHMDLKSSKNKKK